MVIKYWLCSSHKIDVDVVVFPNGVSLLAAHDNLLTLPEKVGGRTLRSASRMFLSGELLRHDC
jgi:hypothetical protein